MTWYYKDKEFTSDMLEEDEIGFVYEILDKHTNMKYIGKKLVKSTRKLPPLKGKKRRRTKVIETDWETYYGSSEEVKALVEESGPDRFHREILHICNTKSELTYFEMKEQIDREVLLRPDEYYNAFIGGKLNRSGLKRLWKG